MGVKANDFAALADKLLVAVFGERFTSPLEVARRADGARNA